MGLAGPLPYAADLVSSSLDIWLASRARRAVSRSKAAPCGALRSAGRSCGACDLAHAKSSRPLRTGGAYRDRTDDLMLAKQPLSQLS